MIEPSHPGGKLAPVSTHDAMFDRVIQMDWWVTEPGSNPIGPVTTELILRGIDADKVPLGALVCEVGGKSWRPLAEVEAFADAVASKGRPRRFSESAERTIADADISLGESGGDEPVPLRRFDGTNEHTVVDLGAVAPDAPLVRIDSHGEEGEDRTIVEPHHGQPDPA